MLDFPRWKITAILLACFVFVLFALPNGIAPQWRQHIPAWLPSKTVNLGLDLRGGSYLLLEVDYATFKRERVAALVDEVRAKLRGSNIGYRTLVTQDDRVTFILRRETVPANVNIAKLLRDIHEGLEVTEDGDAFAIGFTPEYDEQTAMSLIEHSIEIVDRRVNETGTREPIIQRQGRDRILLQVPGLENPEQLKAVLGPTAKLTMHMVDDSTAPEDIARGMVPPGVRIFPGDPSDGVDENGRPMRYALQARPLLTGDMLENAGTTYFEGRPSVSFQFNTEGARRFGDVTSKNVGKLFAIVLDGKVLTAPRINTPILGGSGVIYGNFTPETANNLAILLRAGALPAPLKIVEERSIGPSLGADSIEAGKRASLIAVVLVMGFMWMTYGLFGFFANVALFMNLIIILAVLSMFGATLTLPGIAGIVLTLGMAVDANVLIYERMREEVRAGKSTYAAIETGFRAAFATIIDAHVTGLFAAMLLFFMGSSTVKGFGVTLSIGITASLFTAILITRLMIVTWLRRTKPKALPI